MRVEGIGGLAISVCTIAVAKRVSRGWRCAEELQMILGFDNRISKTGIL